MQREARHARTARRLQESRSQFPARLTTGALIENHHPLESMGRFTISEVRAVSAEGKLVFELFQRYMQRIQSVHGVARCPAYS